MAVFLIHSTCPTGASGFEISEDDERIVISSPTLDAVVPQEGLRHRRRRPEAFWTRRAGFRDAGFGLDIVDWIMEPGSDEAYRDQLARRSGLPVQQCLPRQDGRSARSRGRRSARKAKELSPRVIRGKDFVAVTSSFKYQIAAPGKKTGSEWSQMLVFPAGKRYFISSDKITSVNASDAMFLRIDMPGHIKHKQGDTFSEVYLSYARQDSGERVLRRTSRPTRSSTIAATTNPTPEAVHPRLSPPRSEDRHATARGSRA